MKLLISPDLYEALLIGIFLLVGFPLSSLQVYCVTPFWPAQFLHNAHSIRVALDITDWLFLFLFIFNFSCFNYISWCTLFGFCLELLCFLDLEYLLLFQLGSFQYYVFKYALCAFIWDPYNVNASMFIQFQRVSNCPFLTFYSFSFFCSASVISYSCVCQLLICSSVSYDQLLIHF